MGGGYRKRELGCLVLSFSTFLAFYTLLKIPSDFTLGTAKISPGLSKKSWNCSRKLSSTLDDQRTLVFIENATLDESYASWKSSLVFPTAPFARSKPIHIGIIADNMKVKFTNFKVRLLLSQAHRLLSTAYSIIGRALSICIFQSTAKAKHGLG